MGTAQDYICDSCGYRVEFVTGDFDFGFSGAVTTPIVCPKHAIQQADTGRNVRSLDWEPTGRDSFPCPVCHLENPRWDRKTCPKCGEPTMAVDPARGQIMWD